MPNENILFGGAAGAQAVSRLVYGLDGTGFESQLGKKLPSS